jgi:cell division protein FtsL
VSPEEAPIKVLRKIEKFVDERLLLVIFNRLYILLIISILSGILTIIFSTFWLRSWVNNLG